MSGVSFMASCQTPLRSRNDDPDMQHLRIPLYCFIWPVVCDEQTEWSWPTSTGQRRFLRNDQFAAALFFERHGMVERDDGALGLVVGWRLGGNTLQPEPRRGHQREQGSALLGGETDDLIRHARDYRQ